MPGDDLPQHLGKGRDPPGIANEDKESGESQQQAVVHPAEDAPIHHYQSSDDYSEGHTVWNRSDCRQQSKYKKDGVDGQMDVAAGDLCPFNKGNLYRPMVGPGLDKAPIEDNCQGHSPHRAALTGQSPPGRAPALPYRL